MNVENFPSNLQNGLITYILDNLKNIYGIVVQIPNASRYRFYITKSL
jgi:hypothetical protein